MNENNFKRKFCPHGSISKSQSLAVALSTVAVALSLLIVDVAVAVVLWLTWGIQFKRSVYVARVILTKYPTTTGFARDFSVRSFPFSISFVWATLAFCNALRLYFFSSKQTLEYFTFGQHFNQEKKKKNHRIDSLLRKCVVSISDSIILWIVDFDLGYRMTAAKQWTPVD